MWLISSANYANAADKVDKPVRIAIIAENKSVLPLVDLLTVKFEGERFELVERAEIDRILKEQRLNAGSLIDASRRIKLGELLRAKGLIFIGKYGERRETVCENG